jgi:cyclic pyranopterin phosphate synthase
MNKNKSNPINRNKNRPNQVFLAMLGFSCNNNCIMCTTKPKEKNYKDRDTKEILDDLQKGINQGFKKVEFTGGEPTMRRDILDLIKYAKDLGYKDIAISTNGRMLSYNNFTEELIKSGIGRVNFSLYGHNAKIHDAITRTPQSFEQTIQGIKNVQKFPKVIIIVNTVVTRLNYQHLAEIGNFLSSLKINFFNILDLIPDGYGKDFYKTLAIEMGDLSSALNGLEGILNKFSLVTFFDFPLCLFKPKIRDNPYTTFITAERRKSTAKQVGYKPIRFEKEKGDVYTDIHKKRIAICAKCKFYRECGGVWKDHLDLYGDKKIIILAQRNQCLS